MDVWTILWINNKLLFFAERNSLIFFSLTFCIKNYNGFLVIDLVFIDQTDLRTIVGQEGKALVIKCTSVTRQFITTLELEVNGLIIAIGDNQSVIYSFTPDRTDHLTKYKCIDSKQSWIMMEVTLFISCKYIQSWPCYLEEKKYYVNLLYEISSSILKTYVLLCNVRNI